MVALVPLVLPLPRERTGDYTPVVVRTFALPPVLVSCFFPWTTKQSRWSQSGAWSREPYSSLALHQKRSWTLLMMRAFLGVVPCPGRCP